LEPRNLRHKEFEFVEAQDLQEWKFAVKVMAFVIEITVNAVSGTKAQAIR